MAAVLRIPAIFHRLRLQIFFLGSVGLRCLKGVCYKIFDPSLFHDLNPSGPLINSLKYFWFRFRRDIRSQSDLHHVAKMISAVTISVVCCTPRIWSPRSASHHGDDLRGVLHTSEIAKFLTFRFQSNSFTIYVITYTNLPDVLHTAEMISTVCIIPLRWSPRCESHRRDKLHTTGMKSKFSLVSGCF